MENIFTNYEQSLDLKELGFGFDDELFGKFYTKPNCKMFGIDEHGRYYNIKNIPKKLYTVGEYAVLKVINIIPAVLFSQAFKFFRDNYKLHNTITSISQESWQFHITKPGQTLGILYEEDFYTYEEAEIACLDKLIEIAKKL